MSRAVSRFFYRAMTRVVGPGEGCYFRAILAVLLVFVITVQATYVTVLVSEPALCRLTAPVTLVSPIVMRGGTIDYSLSYCLTREDPNHLVMAVFRSRQESLLVLQPPSRLTRVYVEAQPWFLPGCQTVTVTTDVPTTLEAGTYYLDVRRVWLTPLSIASRIFELRYRTPEFRVE